MQLALEPEAASLYCIGNIEELLKDSTGGHHLIVDCGGGTVDVVAHRWFRVPPGNRLCVDETHKVHGGPYGSFAINAEFAKLLLKIFKIDESGIRARCGSQWSKLIFEEFEKAKCPFDNFNLDSEATISISPSIYTYITNLHHKTISELIDDHKKDLESDLDLSQKLHNCAKKFNKTTSEVFASYKKLKCDEDDLVVPFVVMAILFIPVTDQIVKIVEDVLGADKDNSIKSICMVGGFSENKFLFSEIDAHFSSRVKVKTVPAPSYSVLFGSIKFGKNCEIIRSRIMPQTLGIETWDDFQADKHDEKRKYEDTNTGKCYCTQIFTEFVQIGQSISIENAMPSQVFTPVQSKDNTCCVSIFGSFEKQPKYINDPECYRVGEIIIKDLPPPPVNGIPCPITVQMDVRGTEIVVTAVSNAEGGCHPLNLKLDWMTDKFTASK